MYVSAIQSRTGQDLEHGKCQGLRKGEGDNHEGYSKVREWVEVVRWKASSSPNGLPLCFVVGWRGKEGQAGGSSSFADKLLGRIPQDAPSKCGRSEEGITLIACRGEVATPGHYTCLRLDHPQSEHQ